MSVKDGFTDQVKAQTEVWQAQIKNYQAQMGEAGEKAREEYGKAVKQLEAQVEAAKGLAAQAQSAGETAFKDMQSASQNALAELQRGWAEALSRFK